MIGHGAAAVEGGGKTSRGAEIAFRGNPERAGTHAARVAAHIVPVAYRPGRREVLLIGTIGEQRPGRRARLALLRERPQERDLIIRI